MKKASILLMLLTATTIITLNAAIVPVKADKIYRTIFAGSPHAYTPKWNEMGVGELAVWNDGSYLYVQYIMKWGNWELTETHVAVATSLEDIPQTKSGNPKVGKFPYKMEHDPAVTTYTYTIDLEWDAGIKLYIAAHAVVQNGCQEETAWADCQGPAFVFPGANWASYITYVVQSFP